MAIDGASATEWPATSVVATSDPLAAALPNLLKDICEALGWQVAEIWRVDSSAGLLRWEALWHVPSVDAHEFQKVSQDVTTTPGRGLPGRVWANGASEWVRDVVTQPDFLRAPFAARAGLHTSLAVPLRSGSDIAGVLALFATHIREPGEYDITTALEAAAPLTQYIARRRAEDDVDRLLRVRDAITEAITDVLYVVDTAGHLVWWNKRMETVTGLSAQDLRGRPAIGFFPENVQQIVAEAILAVFRDGTAEIEVPFVTVSGELPYHFKGVILKDADGKVIGLTGVGRDISERKRNEEAAQHWSSLYNALFKAQSDLGLGIAIGDGGRLTFVNDALCQICGYSQDELLAMQSVLELAPPENREEVTQRLAQRLSGEGAPDHVETVIQHRDGHRVDIEFSVKPVHIGERSQLFAVVRDISKRKQIEASLGERSRQLAEAQRLAHIGSWHWDILNNRIAWSDELYSIYGLEHGEFAATFEAYLERVHPDDRERTREIVGQAVTDLRPFTFEERIIRPDGAIRVLESRGEVIANELGRALRMTGACQDITERSEAQEALRRSEERYRALIDTCPDAVVIHDGRSVIFANEAAAALGRAKDPAELIGRPVEDFIHPDYRQMVRERAIQIIQKGENLLAVELKYIRDDGSLVDVEAKGARITMPDGTTAIQTIIRDITERKRNDEDLRREVLFVKLLQVVATTANLSETVEETMQIVVDQICKYIGWPIGHVYLAGAVPGDAMIPTDIWHMDSAEQFQAFRSVTAATHLLPGTGLPGRVLYSGQPAWIPDVALDANFPRAKAALDIGVKAGFAFPVTAGREVYAVFEFFSDDAVEPDQQMLEVMGHVGNQLGRVIERKRAEQALRESEDRYRRLIESSPDAIVIYTGEGEIALANQAAADLIGAEGPGQITGKTVWDFVHPQSAAAIRERGRLLTDELGFAPLAELKFVRADGSTVDVESVARLVVYDGKPAVQVAARDVTVRQKVNEELRNAVSLHAATVEATADGILVVDRQGRMVSFNQRFLQMWRIPQSIAQSREDDQALAYVVAQLNEPEQFLAKVKELYATPVAESSDMIEFKDGRTFERYSHPQRIGEEVVGRVWSFRDVSERKRAEDELARHADDLERFNRLAVGRELRMIELKRDINELSASLGRTAPYDLSFAQQTGADAVAGDD